jgi:FtsZ-binding cell division protein ZapB
LTEKSKLDEDFDKFNLDIEQAAEAELIRLHVEINALKEKANKMSEELLSPPSDEAKRN